MARRPSTTFTERELEIMQILWDRKQATVRDIQAALPPGRHYNTVLTIIRVLERKGHVSHRQEGRGFVYRAVAAPEKSRSSALSHLIDSVFGGSSESVVLNMIETGTLTLDELDEIRRKLKKRPREAGK
ncbi:MAG TPA: BlaI/MecI/CopY family transcriptional regulator [Terriglobia bacterium]|nr:BlaI/MecI/CopY family transcriptional regulator [Terriglobia bacterium]